MAPTDICNLIACATCDRARSTLSSRIRRILVYGTWSTADCSCLGSEPRPGDVGTFAQESKASKLPTLARVCVAAVHRHHSSYDFISLEWRKMSGIYIIKHLMCYQILLAAILYLSTLSSPSSFPSPPFTLSFASFSLSSLSLFSSSS